jgi:predicted MFS family arabinose efflux permease
MLVSLLNWNEAFLALAVPAVAAAALALWLQESRDAGMPFPPKRAQAAARPQTALTAPKTPHSG